MGWYNSVSQRYHNAYMYDEFHHENYPLFIMLMFGSSSTGNIHSSWPQNQIFNQIRMCETNLTDFSPIASKDIHFQAPSVSSTEHRTRLETDLLLIGQPFQPQQGSALPSIA